MRDDDERKCADEAGPTSASDGHNPPADDEVQRRGRQRMLAMWRDAVQCLTDAAERDSAPGDGADDDEARPVTEATWIFPPSAKRRAGN